MEYPKSNSTEAAIRGGETELRFFEAIQCQVWNKPFWLYDIRHATREEDNHGIDAIATLDVGSVHIQIKTSHAGRLEHENRHGKSQIIIVISDLMTPRAIRTKITDLLYYRRGFLCRVKKEKQGARR